MLAATEFTQKGKINMIKVDANSNGQEQRWTSEGCLICNNFHQVRPGFMSCPECRGSGTDFAYDLHRSNEYTNRDYAEQFRRQLKGEGLEMVDRVSRTTKHKQWLERLQRMENKGRELQPADGPRKKKHKSEDRQRTMDDKKADNVANVWDSGFAQKEEYDWEKWGKLVNYARQGRTRDNMRPMTSPPYDPDADYLHDWTTGKDLLPPPANPVFFLQFAIIIKRFRNRLDWVFEHRRSSSQCCNLTQTDSRGTEEWYPRYWAEWDLQAMQWISPPDFGCLWMFDWENPSEKYPLEFQGLEE